MIIINNNNNSCTSRIQKGVIAIQYGMEWNGGKVFEAMGGFCVALAQFGS